MCRFDMCTVSGIGWCWAVIAAVAMGLLGYWLGRLHRRDGGPSQKGKAAFSAKSGKTETAALSGVPARIEHPFEELPRLSVEGTWQVRLECNAPENRCVVSCEESLAPEVHIEEVRGGLRIRYRGEARPTQPMTIDVRTTGQPEQYKASGHCCSEVTGARGKAFTCKIAGCGEVKIAEARIGEFRLKLSGASRAECSGEFENARIDVVEAGTVRGKGLFRKLEARVSGASSLELDRVEDADIDLSGASRARLAMTGELIGNVSGASTLKYSGKEVKTAVRVSGSSRLKQVDPEA